MGQRLIISENEKSQISKMYGLVNEQESKEGPLKVQVFSSDKNKRNDVKLVFLIDVDREPNSVRNTKTEFTYKVRGGSKEYTGVFDTSNPGMVQLDRCELLEDSIVPSSHIQHFKGYGAAGCPEDSRIDLKLSSEGSNQMEQLFGKGNDYASNNNKSDDTSNMA